MRSIPDLSGERCASPLAVVSEGKGDTSSSMAEAQTSVVDEARAAKYALIGSSGFGAERRLIEHSLRVGVGPDGLVVPTQMGGDRGNPAPAPQCMCFQIFPMCEHAERVSLRADPFVARQRRRGFNPLDG